MPGTQFPTPVPRAGRLPARKYELKHLRNTAMPVRLPRKKERGQLLVCNAQKIEEKPQDQGREQIAEDSDLESWRIKEDLLRSRKK